MQLRGPFSFPLFSRFCHYGFLSVSNSKNYLPWQKFGSNEGAIDTVDENLGEYSVVIQKCSVIIPECSVMRTECNVVMQKCSVVIPECSVVILK